MNLPLPDSFLLDTCQPVDLIVPAHVVDEVSHLAVETLHLEDELVIEPFFAQWAQVGDGLPMPIVILYLTQQTSISFLAKLSQRNQPTYVISDDLEKFNCTACTP